MNSNFQNRYKQVLNEAPQRVIPPYPPTGADWKEFKRAGFITATPGQYARCLVWKQPDSANFENWLMKNYLHINLHDVNALGKAFEAQYKHYYMEKINLYQSVYESAFHAADMMNLLVSKLYAKYQLYHKSLNQNNPGVASDF